MCNGSHERIWCASGREEWILSQVTSNHVTDAAPYSAQHSRRVVVAITALALGGFAIGTTEFVTMGLLPEIARGIDESIPRTGHIISAYALGVVVGAPVIVSLAARLPRRELAVALVQGIFPLLNPGAAALARAAAQAQALLVAFAFGCLTYAFVTNDFSVQYVAMHSNSARRMRRSEL